MSLINDALKKAQKQRTGEAPPLASMPSVGGESPQRIARRAKPAGFDTLLVRAGIGGVVVLLLVVGGYFAFRSAPEDRSQRAEVSSNQIASPPPTSNVGSPLVGGPAPSTAPVQQPTTSSQQPAVTPPTFTLPIAPKTEPVATKSEPPPVTVAKIETPKQTSPATPPKIAPAQQPAASNQQPAQVAAPAGPAPKLEPRAIEFIENLKVAGIRASPTDAKVLMNDRVYRLGSQVSAEFGLKLVEIANGALTFEDDRGGRYTRTF